MYGDDFWIGLYPNSFDDFEVYPSLDITDLHGNDELVERRLLDQLQNHTDWDILWTHLLGIDHGAHLYNNLERGFGEKVSDVEAIISKIIDSLPNNATLAILSDHGLTTKGTHGGSTDDELHTFIAFYQHDLEFDSRYNLAKLKKVPQTSIAPTISTLANLNIPFSNIGYAIADAVPLAPGMSSFEKILEDFKLYKENQLQILTYLSTYQNKTSFSKDTTSKIAFYKSKVASENERIKEFFLNSSNYPGKTFFFWHSMQFDINPFCFIKSHQIVIEIPEFLIFEINQGIADYQPLHSQLTIES